MKRVLLWCIILGASANVYSTTLHRNYYMLGRKYDIEINDVGVSKVYALGIEYIVLKPTEVDTFRRELATVKERYRIVSTSSSDSVQAYGSQTINEPLTPISIKFNGIEQTTDNQILFPWISQSSGKYNLYIKVFPSRNDSINYASENSMTLMYFASVEELQYLIDAMDKDIVFRAKINSNTEFKPIYNNSPKAPNTSTYTQMSEYQRLRMGLGLSLNTRSWAIDCYLNQFYVNIMSGYGQTHENYKDYLDMSFVNAWGDNVAKTYTNLERCIDVGLFQQRRALLYKAGIGFGTIQEYLLIQEGDVSIFPNGRYTIKGDSKTTINLNLGVGFKFPQPSKIFIMLNTNANSSFFDVGVLFGYVF